VQAQIVVSPSMFIIRIGKLALIAAAQWQIAKRQVVQ